MKTQTKRVSALMSDAERRRIRLYAARADLATGRAVTALATAQLAELAKNKAKR